MDERSKGPAALTQLTMKDRSCYLRGGAPAGTFPADRTAMPQTTLFLIDGVHDLISREAEWSSRIQRPFNLLSLDPDMIVVEGSAYPSGARVGWADYMRLALGYANVSGFCIYSNHFFKYCSIRVF